MAKKHYYFILILLGSLCTVPLYATDHAHHDDSKHHARPGVQSFYTHGDTSFIYQEKDTVNLPALKRGLIDLSGRIKAKEGRKVYFFVGGTGEGKSLSILALQGHTIKKAVAQPLAAHKSEDELFAHLHHSQATFPKAPYEIVKYVLPKDQVPVVGDKCTNAKNSTYIYYPDPKKPQYKHIAFADTEGFFRSRKATSAAMCLSATSFFYTAKANKIGGLVLVISAPALETFNGEGIKRIAYLLQAQLAKNINPQKLKKSLLVMITKADGNHRKAKALRKFRKLIQAVYQAYYATTATHDFLENKLEQIDQPACKTSSCKESITDKSQSLYAESEDIAKETKQLNTKSSHQEERRRLKLFFEMLLKQDVSKHKADNIHNFILDPNKFCFMCPWNKQHVQNILDNKLKSLKPIAASHLFGFDNPVVQYMQDSFRYISIQLNQAVQPLLALRLQIRQIAQQLSLEEMTSETEEFLKKEIENAKANIQCWQDYQAAIAHDDTLDIVFQQSHAQNLPVGASKGSWIVDKCISHKLCKTFQYQQQEPIYAISATYGPGAELTERLPACRSGATKKFPFIEKHFTITQQVDSNGFITWSAVAKSGIGVIKRDGWHFYHATKGKHKAKCQITFYALKRERIATQLMKKEAEKKIRTFKQCLAVYHTKRNAYHKLKSKHKALTDKCHQHQAIYAKACKATASMLRFFVNEVLEDNIEQELIKYNLEIFESITQLTSYLYRSTAKGNSQKETLYPKEEKEHLSDRSASYPSDPKKNQQNPPQRDDSVVFDID